MISSNGNWLIFGDRGVCMNCWYMFDYPKESCPYCDFKFTHAARAAIEEATCYVDTRYRIFVRNYRLVGEDGEERGNDG